MTRKCKVSLRAVTALIVALIFVLPKARANDAVHGSITHSWPPFQHDGQALTRPPAPKSAAVGLRWRATAYHGFHRFSNERPTWMTGAATIGAKSSTGRASFLEMGWVSRHDQNDYFGAIDHYQPIDDRAYANLRVSVAPGADVSPRNDVYAEAFRSLSGAFEVSAGYRFARFPDANVHTPSFGLAKYVGNWYFRLKNSVTPIDGSLGYAVVATVRRYGESSEEFVGGTIAAGREIVGIPGGTVLARSPIAISLYGQRFLTSNAGLRLSVDVVRDGNLSRNGISVGLIARW